MNRPTLQMRKSAERLITFETRAKRSSGTRIPAAFYVCEKLRPHLATLMGGTGFHALLSRALAVANTDDPWLRGVRVKADGSLGGLDGSDAPTDPAAMAEGSIVLVSQLLALLAAFIGENLTLQLVRDTWPELRLADLESSKENTK